MNLNWQVVSTAFITLALAGCASVSPFGKSDSASKSQTQEQPQQVTQPAPQPNTPEPVVEAPVAEPQPIPEIDNSAELIKLQAEREREVHLTLIRKMIQQGNTYAALAHLDAYAKKWGADTPSQRLRADSLRKTQQYDKAEAIYKTLLNQTQSSESWYGLGRVSIEKGDLPGSVPRLEKAIQQDPLYVEAYSDLGLVYLLMNNKQQAYDTLMKASQLSQNDPKIMANLALWGLVYQDFDMARSIADHLMWSEEVRGQVLSQATKIRERFKTEPAQ